MAGVGDQGSIPSCCSTEKSSFLVLLKSTTRRTNCSLFRVFFIFSSLPQPESYNFLRLLFGCWSLNFASEEQDGGDVLCCCAREPEPSSLFHTVSHTDRVCWLHSLCQLCFVLLLCPFCQDW